MGRFVVCGLLLLVAQPALGLDRLTWKWKKDDTFYVKTLNRIKQKLTLEASGREISQDVEQSTLFRYTVRAVNKDGSAELVQKVEEILVTAKIPLEDKPTIRTDNGLKDVELVLHVTPRGEVTKVEGAEALLKKLAGSDSGKLKRVLLGEVPWWMVVAAVVEWSEALRKQATQALGFLPDKPLTKGLRWQRPAGLALGALGHLDGERTYAYDGSPTDKGPVKISFTTTVKGFEPGKGTAVGPRVTRGKFKTSKGKGSLEFDAAAGRLVKADSILEFEGDITIKDPGADAEYRGRLTQEHTTETTVTDKRPK